MAANWFIALPVPSGAWLEALTPPPAVRLFTRHDLHLTVAFLGAVSEARALAAFACAAELPLAPLEISLAQVVPLGARRRPSAFSALLDRGRVEVERAVGAVRARYPAPRAAAEGTEPSTPNPHPCAQTDRRLDTADAASSRLPGLMGAR